MTKYAEYWTPTAIDCYERGCNCRGCLLKNLETKCQMKTAVFELVRKYGKPPVKDGLNETQQAIINAILAGCNTKEDIAKRINKADGVIQNNLNELYAIAENDGLVFYSRIKFNQFVRYIRGELV